MITITKAETYLYMLGLNAGRCVYPHQQTNQVYCMLLPCNSSSTLMNLDSLVEDSSNHSENECTHLKFEGTIDCVDKWSDGVSEFVPKDEFTEYRTGTYYPGYIYCHYKRLADGCIMEYPGTPDNPGYLYTVTLQLNADPSGRRYRQTRRWYQDGNLYREIINPDYSYWDYCSPPQREVNKAILQSELANVAFPPFAITSTSDVACSLFRAACQGMMPLETNNIANAISIIQLIASTPKIFKGMAKTAKKLGKFINMDDLPLLRNMDITDIIKSGADPKKAADAWLKYRYVYTTTKLDIQLHQKHLKEQLAMWNRSNRRKTRRMHATTTSDDVLYNITVDFTPKLSNAIEEAWVLSRAFGLQLSAVNVWDMIPFSFIVDWFAPIGDIASYIDDKVLFNETHFDIGPVIMSGKHVKPVDTSYGTINASCYIRKIIPTPTLKYEEDNGPSERTKIYRGIDAASLIVGRR